MTNRRPWDEWETFSREFRVEEEVEEGMSSKKKVTQIGDASMNSKMRCTAFLRDLLAQVEADELVAFAVVATSASANPDGISLCFKGATSPVGPSNRELQILLAELSVVHHGLLVELASDEREGAEEVAP